MGVSLYVMPLQTYLRGEFKTTWETREELAGVPGFRITPEGLSSPPQPPDHSDEEVLPALRAFLKRVGTFVTTPLEWDEESSHRSATSMSYGSFGSARRRAQQWAYKVNLPRLQAMEAPQIWLPVPFEPTIRIVAPWDEDSEVRVVSAPGLLSELARLTALMAEDPVMEELRSWPPGTMLTGAVAELDSEMSSQATLRRIAESSLQHRVPVIVEG